ncbi:hypothetical protein DEO72_LG5g2423 [Vigna unguiculata]|uniref:Beta-glucosidase n=1 Tax=Vigna unguiculata TaxID=3917 RepID=A0A4D6M0F8_VIGUN|nr:hypothetical protein DEO72_LG5g2423 [Vigna unguiculata]
MAFYSSLFLALFALLVRSSNVTSQETVSVSPTIDISINRNTFPQGFIFGAGSSSNAKSFLRRRACHDLARRTIGDDLWRRWPWCDGTASKRRPWWRQICRAKKRVGGWWVQSFAWWWWVAGAAGCREKERKRRGQPPWKPPRHLQRTITTTNLHGSHRVTLNAVWTCNRTRARFERSSTLACTRVRDHHHAIRAAARDADGEGGRKGK